MTSRGSIRALHLTLCVIFASSFSAPRQPRQFIEISNPLKPSTAKEQLPASFVTSWSTWVLESESLILQKIPADDDNQGYVSPTSIDFLWQPVDLKQPTCHLAVGFHVRDGTLRHILPAVDISLDGKGSHRNRGLCSVPRAYRWMDFSAVMAGRLDDCHLVMQTRPSAKKESGNGENNNNWTTLAEIRSVEKYVTRAVEALAQDIPSQLAEGSFILYVVDYAEKNHKGVECPKPGNELRCLLLEDDDVILGILDVEVEVTAAGSESEYLPQAYKTLFGDEELLRPAFVERKKRLAAEAMKSTGAGSGGDDL